MNWRLDGSAIMTVASLFDNLGRGATLNIRMNLQGRITVAGRMTFVGRTTLTS